MDDRAPRAFPFLTLAGAPERSVVRTLVTVLLGAIAAFGAAMGALAGVLVIAGVLLAVSGGADAGQAISTLLAATRADHSLTTYLFDLAVVGATSLAAAWAFLAVSAWRAGRSLATFVTTAPRFRWRHAVTGLVVFLPVVAAEIWLDSLAAGAGPADPIPVLTVGGAVGDRVLYALAALAFLWMAALAEELLFRGWLLQQTHALTRNLVAVVVITALVFTLAHGDLSPGGLITRFALGAGWAWVVLRLGGVEFAAGAHLANNLGIALLAKPVLLAPTPDQPLDLASVAMQVGTVAALAVAVELWARRRAVGGATSAFAGP